MAEDRPETSGTETEDAELKDAERREALARADKAEVDLQSALLSLEVEVNEARDDEASDLAHRTYVFRWEIDAEEEHIAACRSTLRRWQRLDDEAEEPNRPYTLVIKSPGGDVFDGLFLFDELRSIAASGHRLTTVIRGYAASMAGFLAQAGDHRVMGPNAYLMLHPASSGAIGKVADLRTEADLTEQITRQMCDVYAERSTMSADEIYDRISRGDWWLRAEEALRLGFVDEIG